MLCGRTLLLVNCRVKVIMSFGKKLNVLIIVKRLDLPTNIEGISGDEKISELWCNHYKDSFNCVQSTVQDVTNVDFDVNMVISPEEVKEAIRKLDDNKSCGLDTITAEHLKLASPKLMPLLAMCISGFLIHGILPDSMISVVLVPCSH